jgi:hypothetical protein
MTASTFHRFWDHYYFDPGWHSWGSPSSGAAGAPGLTTTAMNGSFWTLNLKAFVLGSNGHIWEGTSTDGTVDGPWGDRGSPAGKTLVGDVDAAAWALDGWSAFVFDTTGNLQWLQWDMPSFSYKWRTQLGKPSGAAVFSPGAVGYGHGQFLVEGGFGSQSWEITENFGTVSSWTPYGGSPPIGIDLSAW